jgi:hypothetical protein
MYVPSGLMPSHSSTSFNITGVCAALNLFCPSIAAPPYFVTNFAFRISSFGSS